MARQRDLNRTRERIMAAAQKEFAASGFAGARTDAADTLRMWQWEALDTSNRKLVAEEQRRSLLRAEVARWRRAKAAGTLSADADEEMLLLVSCALRTFPLAMPQIPLLVTGMNPLDPEFMRRWSACLEWVGRRLLGPTQKNGDELDGKNANESRAQKKPPTRTRIAKQSPSRKAARGVG